MSSVPVGVERTFNYLQPFRPVCCHLAESLLHHYSHSSVSSVHLLLCLFLLFEPSIIPNPWDVNRICGVVVYWFWNCWWTCGFLPYWHLWSSLGLDLFVRRSLSVQKYVDVGDTSCIRKHCWNRLLSILQCKESLLGFDHIYRRPACNLTLLI